MPLGQMLIPGADLRNCPVERRFFRIGWQPTTPATTFRKQDYFARFCFADGLRHLAEDYPFQPRTLALSTVNTNH